MNTVTIEKHFNGFQYYLNDEAYLWFDAENKELEARLQKDNKAEVERINAKYTTEHYRLDWTCSREMFMRFFEELAKISPKIEYFHAGIGEIYLTMKTLDHDLLTTHYDVFHNWRKEIKVINHLSSKPQPQKNWQGSWINYYELREAANA